MKSVCSLLVMFCVFTSQNLSHISIFISNLVRLIADSVLKCVVSILIFSNYSLAELTSAYRTCIPQNVARGIRVRSFTPEYSTFISIELCFDYLFKLFFTLFRVIYIYNIYITFTKTRIVKNCKKRKLFFVYIYFPIVNAKYCSFTFLIYLSKHHVIHYFIKVECSELDTLVFTVRTVSLARNFFLDYPLIYDKVILYLATYLRVYTSCYFVFYYESLFIENYCYIANVSISRSHESFGLASEYVQLNNKIFIDSNLRRFFIHCVC